MLSRLAIVNRGEPALRLIRAVRELNEEGVRHQGHRPAHRRGARALFVRAADEGVLLREKGDLGSPYLDHAELERAMIAASRADAVWPGWGFVSEDAGFVELCDRIG